MDTQMQADNTKDLQPNTQQDTVPSAETFKEDARTVRTLRNIKNALAYSLNDHYKIDKDEVVEQILKIHGLHKDQFDFIANIENVINKQISDASIDDNANKEDKTVEIVYHEVFASAKKAIGYDMLYRMLKELYGKSEAKRLSGKMYDFSLALADSTNILKPYCFAIDASPLVMEGRSFGQLKSKPAKRVSSYISALCETVHQMSNHLAGAIAIASMFFDIAHILIYREQVTLQDLRDKTKKRKSISNEFQQLVHSLNHLSREGAQSPFTNISIFDKTKLRAMIADNSLGWYFPDPEPETNREKYLKYVVDYITEIQDIFLEFFNAGDPSSGGMLYRFPIVTLNLSKKLEKDQWVIEDKETLAKFCKLDIFRYNIFASEQNKFASCCRLLSDNDMIELASQANSFGGGSSLSIGSHRVITINFNRIGLECKKQEQFYKMLEERIEDSIKILKAHKQLLKLEQSKGLQMFLSNNWLKLPRMFSTVGMIGLVEAEQAIKNYKDYEKGKDIKKDILIFLNTKVAEYGKKHGLICNIEQIPGESMAVRLPKVDKLLFGEKNVPHKLYSNQFIPLWEDATIWERLEIDGKYNRLITGGGIVHAQIGEKVTQRQAENIIKFAVNSGCEHFALNAVYAECEDHHVTLGKVTKCHVCGKPIKDYLTRIVGFFTRVSSWSEARRSWEFPKRTFVKPD